MYIEANLDFGPRNIFLPFADPNLTLIALVGTGSGIAVVGLIVFVGIAIVWMKTKRYKLNVLHIC